MTPMPTTMMTPDTIALVETLERIESHLETIARLLEVASASRARADVRDLGGVRRQPFGELARAAERDVVAAVHLVGLDPQTLSCMTARPCRWKHPVVAAQQVSRRRARPRCERPWFAQRPRALVSFAPLRLGRKVGMHVVVEDVVVAAPLVAAVRPPVVEELAGRRDHRRDEDEQVDRNAGADERRGEAAERMTDDDDLAAVADRSHDSFGVVPPAGRFVFAREIDRSRVVPVLAQLARDQVPIPGASAAAVDQGKGRHPSYLPTRYLTCVTLGASIARTCSSFSSGPTPSKSRAPPPSTSGTMFNSSTSTSPAAR
jgi:hypothetical protein